MTLASAVVDASVAVKWVVREPDTDAALGLLANGTALFAPAHWLAEVANTLWAKAAVHGELPRAMMEARIAWLAELGVEETPLPALVGDAARLAFDLRLTVHDSLCLALAARRGAPLVTADRRLIERANSSAAAAGLLVWVGELGKAGETRGA